MIRVIVFIILVIGSTNSIIYNNSSSGSSSSSSSNKASSPVSVMSSGKFNISGVSYSIVQFIIVYYSIVYQCCRLITQNIIGRSAAPSARCRQESSAGRRTRRGGRPQRADVILSYSPYSTPSEIDSGLFWADFTDLEGKCLFHRIG